jgi:hypothetical protein
MLYPDPKRGRGNKDEALEKLPESGGFKREILRQARSILRHSFALAQDVIADRVPLDAALARVKEEQARAGPPLCGRGGHALDSPGRPPLFTPGATMPAAPALEVRDVAVLQALITAAEVVAITRASLPSTQRAIADLQRLVEIERKRLDEAAAKARFKDVSGKREHEENCRRWGVPV